MEEEAQAWGCAACVDAPKQGEFRASQKRQDNEQSGPGRRIEGDGGRRRGALERERRDAEVVRSLREGILRCAPDELTHKLSG